MTKPLLLIEDDQSLGKTLSERLTHHGFDVRWASSIADARLIAKTISPDVAIVDVGLPDGSGFDVARELKQSSRTRIIFLTAMNSAAERLRGFDVGADDYIPKPFHLREFIMRLKRVIDQPRAAASICVSATTIDLQSHTITFEDGSRVSISERESAILGMLVERAPQTVSRQSILDELIQDGRDRPTPRTIDNVIVRLRSYLPPDTIRSVRGVGYQWRAPKDPHRS